MTTTLSCPRPIEGQGWGPWKPPISLFPLSRDLLFLSVCAEVEGRVLAPNCFLEQSAGFEELELETLISVFKIFFFI